MGTVTVTLRIRTRWWLRPYLAFIVLKARVTGRLVDMDRVEAMILKATITEVR